MEAALQEYTIAKTLNYYVRSLSRAASVAGPASARDAFAGVADSRKTDQ